MVSGRLLDKMWLWLSLVAHKIRAAQLPMLPLDLASYFTYSHKQGRKIGIYYGYKGKNNRN